MLCKYPPHTMFQETRHLVCKFKTVLKPQQLFVMLAMWELINNANADV